MIKEICNNFRENYPYFYKNICISRSQFRIHDWDVKETIYNNEEIFFFDEDYLSNEDQEFFYRILRRFYLLIKKIILKIPIIDMSDLQSRQFKHFICHKYYRYISPIVIYKIYSENTNDINKIVNELNSIVVKMNNILKEYRYEYDKLVDFYVYGMPLERKNHRNYLHGFVNSILLLIIHYTNKLMDENIYAAPFLLRKINQEYFSIKIIQDFSGYIQVI
jgi:hypothetical protein